MPSFCSMIFTNRRILVLLGGIAVSMLCAFALPNYSYGSSASDSIDLSEGFEWTHSPVDKGQLSKLGLEPKNQADRAEYYGFIIIECNGMSKVPSLILLGVSSDKKKDRPDKLIVRGNGNYDFRKFKHVFDELNDNWDIEANISDLKKFINVINSQSNSIILGKKTIILPPTNASISEFMASCIY